MTIDNNSEAIYEAWIKEAKDLLHTDDMKKIEDCIVKAHNPNKKELRHIRNTMCKILYRDTVGVEQVKKEIELERIKRENERGIIEVRIEEGNLLTDPNLLEILVTEIHKKIIREVDTIKTILLCTIGSLIENAKKTSFNLIVNSVTGSGKDWVVDNALGIIPKDRVIKRTRITEKTFTYWHNPKFEPEWTWDGKVFYNEDVSNSVLNSDVFKVMSSTGSTATVLVNQKPVDIEIVGTPVIIVTTENPSPSREILRRFSIVNLDESIDQTEAIIDRKLELAKTGENLEYDDKIIDALKLLERIKVRIPFSDKLKRIFPMNTSSHILMRTHTDRFLDFIKSSCALYQFQRQKDEDGYYLAQPEDYENARIVLQKITSNPFMMPLTKDEQKIIDKFRELPKGNYSVSDLEQHITFVSESTLKRKLKKLANYGLLKVSSEYREDVRRYVIVYNYEPFSTIIIPKYEELLNSDLHEPNESNELSDFSEPDGQQGQKVQSLSRPTHDND